MPCNSLYLIQDHNMHSILHSGLIFFCFLFSSHQVFVIFIRILWNSCVMRNHRICSTLIFFFNLVVIFSAVDLIFFQILATLHFGTLTPLNGIHHVMISYRFRQICLLSQICSVIIMTFLLPGVYVEEQTVLPDYTTNMVGDN